MSTPGSSSSSDSVRLCCNSVTPSSNGSSSASASVSSSDSNLVSSADLTRATPIKRRRGTNEKFEKTFFDEDEREPTIKTCKATDCRKVFKNSKTFNLERHIKTQHTKLFELFCNPEPDPLASSLNSVLQTTDDEHLITKKLYVRMSRQELLADCVEICTVNGYPLALFNSTGMRSHMQKITSCFPEQFTVNSETVKAAILKESAKIRQKVKEDLKGKFVCIKVDCATRKLTSYIGINAQYIHAGKIEVRLLKIAPVYTRHTGINLKNLILETLRENGIPLLNVISSTSDNGSNILKMTRELHKESIAMMNAFADLDEANGEPLESNEAENGDYSEDEDEDEDELYVDMSTLDPETEAQHNLLVALIDEALAEIGILEVRCAAHSLQLSIRDAIMSILFLDLIEKVRGLVNQLKTQTIMNIIHTGKAPIPVGDNKTRWNSTFHMLARFLQLKDFMSTHLPDIYCQMTSYEWELLEDIINALEPCAVATIKLQKEQLPYSEVLPIFFTLLVSLRQLKTVVADAAVDAIEERKRLLFKPHLYAAVLLDRRYNRLLDADELKLAELQLLSAWERISSTVASAPDVPATPETSTEGNAPQKSMLQKIMEEKEAGNDRFRPVTVPNRSTEGLKEKISNFLRQSMLPEKVDIVAHWETEKLHWPELYELSKFFLGIPATQTSVERLFSHLKFIKNNLRQKLKEELLQAIMAVRMYHHLSRIRPTRKRRRVVGVEARDTS